MATYPPDVELIPVSLSPADIGVPDRGWRCYKARRGDGVCWAVVHDGLTAHEGPPRWEDEFHGRDFNDLILQLEAYARAAFTQHPDN